MVFVVPFDGSGLAEAALVRAAEFGTVLEERVVAVCVIPKNNAGYARERGWLHDDESFDMETVISRVHEQVTDLCPSANFRHETVGRWAPEGEISSQLRQTAKQLDASMVFIGSENAGHVVASVSSVGRSVATDDAYDVVIVRDRTPAKSVRVRDAAPESHKSNFYR